MVTLTGDYGYTQYRVNGGAQDEFDISAASWSVNNDPSGSRQVYPFVLDKHAVPVTIQGNGSRGSGPYNFNGLMSLTEDWGRMYGWGNSAAVFCKECPGPVTFSDISLYRIWDGIRATGGDDYTIKGCYVNISRDDAVECDQGYNGLIQDCLFEDCFSGISLGDANTPVSSLNNLVRIDRCLVHNRVFNYRGDPATHGAPLKADQNTPKLLITDCVFAIARPDHETFNRLTLAFSRVQSGSARNYYLNLSDDPLPGNYPTIPPSFTVLNGQPARDYWATARKAYLAGDPPRPVDPPVNPPKIQPDILHVLEINATSGAIRAKTPKAYVADVTVGAANAYGSGMQTVMLTVV